MRNRGLLTRQTNRRDNQAVVVATQAAALPGRFATRVAVPWALAAGLLLLLVSAVLLFVTLRTPVPRTIDVGAPGDAFFIANFLPPEVEQIDGRPPPPGAATTTFRWSGPDSRLLLPPPGTGHLALRLRLHGTEPAPDFVLEHNEQPVAAFAVDQPGWHVYHVLLPQAVLAGFDRQPVQLDLAGSTHVPGSHAGRALGVPVDQISLVPLAAVDAPVAVPLQQTLLLTWGLALLVIGVWGLDRQLLPASAVIARALRVYLVLALCAGGLIAWARYAPYTLAWLLPALLALLLPATLLLVGSRVLARWPVRSNAIAFVAGRGWFVAGLTVLLTHLLLLPPLPVSLRGTAALLLLWLPGFLLARLVFRHEQDPLVQLFLGVCGGLALSIPLLLGLHALPGPLPAWLLLLVLDGLSLWLGWLLLRRTCAHDDAPTNARSPSGDYRSLLILLALMLLGAGLRLAFLGSAEFQGDEARPVILATGVPGGQDEVLLLNWKGPVEVLLPAGPLVLTGQMNEWAARLPCALAGIAVLAGAYLLACTMFNRDTEASGAGTAIGLVAVAILAVDGLLIGFSRILQYQSVVVLMMLGALWCAWRFYQGVAHPQRYLLGAAICTATALLAHYDGIFVLPALAWLILAGMRRRGWPLAGWPRALLPSALLGAALLLIFYLPFMLHDRFGGNTVDYLNRRIAGGTQEAGQVLFNHLASYYYPQATFYNPSALFLTLAGVLLAGMLAWIARYVRPRPLSGALVLLLLTASLLLVMAPERFALAHGLNWAILAFGLPLAGLALAPATPAALRTLVLWFAFPFVAMAFIIAKPGTHFYTIDTAAALLIGLAGVSLARWLRHRRLAGLQLPMTLGGLALLGLSLVYLYLAFVRLVPEYYRTFPAVRPAIFAAGYGDEVPETSYFGFPHRDGWKVIGELYRQGVLQGDHHSNVKEVVTGWYTHGALRCEREPAYYFAAWYEASKRAFIDIPPGYHLFGYVMVDGIRTMDIYSRAPVEHPPQRFDLADHARAFDRRSVTDFPIPRALDALAPGQRLEQSWQAGITLYGYDLDHRELQPGQTAAVSLYWGARPEAASGLTDYRAFLDLRDHNGTVVLQATPHCGSPSPTTWANNDINTTAFTIPANTNLPPGTYTLHAGLRHTRTGAPLPRSDGTTELPITTLTVMPP